MEYLPLDTTTRLFELLNCQEIELPCIKKLEIKYEHFTKSITDLQLSAFFKFRNSLTELKLFGLASVSGHFAPYGGIYKYLSTFSHLQNCSIFLPPLGEMIYADYQMQQLDIGIILESNKQLKEFTLEGYYHIIYQPKKFGEDREQQQQQQQQATASHGKLEKLTPGIKHIDVNALRYITNTLVNMHHLSIVAYKAHSRQHSYCPVNALPPTDSNNTTGPKEVMVKFKNLCKKMKCDGVSYLVFDNFKVSYGLYKE